MSTTSTDTAQQPPAEGRPDLGIPGADQEPNPNADDPAGGPAGPTADLPERLARRIGDPGAGVVTGEPDLLPDVEPPDNPM